MDITLVTIATSIFNYIIGQVNFLSLTSHNTAIMATLNEKDLINLN